MKSLLGRGKQKYFHADQRHAAFCERSCARVWDALATKLLLKSVVVLFHCDIMKNGSCTCQ